MTKQPAHSSSRRPCPTFVLDDGEFDTADLVAEVEQEFGFRLTEIECETTQTLGQFHRLILQKLNLPGALPCASRAAFLETRNAIRRHTRPDLRPRPCDELTELFAAPAAQFWPALARELNLDPRLCRSSRVRWAMLVSSVILGGAVFLATGVLASETALVCASAPIAFVAAWSLLVQATRFLARHAPHRTVRDVTLQRLCVSFESCSSSWTAVQRYVWRRMTRLVANCYGARQDSLIPSTRFVGTLELPSLLPKLGAW